MNNFTSILAALSITLLCMGFVMPVIKIEAGIYFGKFKVVYPSGKTYFGKTMVEFSQSSYTCTGNKKRFPAGGSGTYSINETETTITFTDENMWTADFDWNLILNGVYDYTSNGKILTLTARRDGGGYYEYRLTKK